jgi:haloacetate dehalogenase
MESKAEDELFAGFSSRLHRTQNAEVFLREGGSGPPLLLIHGYPQTHACWHKVAAELARRFTVILCDLPGYGKSRVLLDDGSNSSYSKRSMAGALVTAVKQLGFEKFRVVGHDRGARVGYRMALDHPGCVESLGVLSILPTFAMWRKLRDIDYAMTAFRWFFLAQEGPLPETLVQPVAKFYLRATLSAWTKSKDLTAFSTAALAAYDAAFNESTIIGSSRDYRAGWTVDRIDDEHDISAGRKIRCPTLVLWSKDEFPDEIEMLASWKTICDDVKGIALDSGHFLPEEAPEEVIAALLSFLAQRQ